MNINKSDILKATETCFVFPEFEDKVERRKIIQPMPDYEDYLKEKKRIAKEKESNNAGFLAPCFAEPLLNKEQERHLFRMYNYFKYMAKKNATHNPSYNTYLSEVMVQRAAKYLQKANDVRNLIAQCNCRIAANVAKMTKGCTEDFYSESYMHLFYVIEKFDPRRGIKFSTYATWALRRNLWKISKVDFKSKFAELEGADNILGYDIGKEREINQETLESLIHKVIQFADKRESRIIKRRYGIDTKNRNEATLQEIGTEFKVSKERIRQLESRGLQQIREGLEQNPELLSELLI